MTESNVPSKTRLEYLLELVAYPGNFTGRPSADEIRAMAKAELAVLRNAHETGLKP